MAPRRHSAARTGLIVAIVAAFAGVLAPAPALAANSVYWAWATLANNSAVAGGLAVANAEGGNGRDLTISGAPIDHPLGVAIDARAGRIYWANFGSSINYCTGPLTGGNTISFANLDGTGGGLLNTSGATVSGPDGLAIDPAAGRVYWANDHANSISYANLNGSGGHDLNTKGATLGCPAGLVLDPARGRVYWTNFVGNTISYANLDGSGGGDLPTAGASMSGPYGLAIDAADGRIYWANNTGNSISYANLDGSGGDDLSHAGANVNGPWGVAIDPAAGRIYWANNLGSSISYANLDESGGGDLSTPPASVDHPKYPALLEAPNGAGAPVVSGGSRTGSTLACSPGTWAADLVESFLYRAPQDFAYRWSVNGTPIAEAASAITAKSPGSYVCQVTAGNYAGTTTQTSASFTVLKPPPSSVSVASHKVSPSGTITLGVLVHAPGQLTGTATFTQKTTRIAGRGRHRHPVTSSRTVVYGTASLSATGSGVATLMIRPTGTGLRLLKADRKLTVKVGLTFTPGGATTGRASLHFVVRAMTPTAPHHPR
jgi:DNA-binding beta-propeller fold protein YncE